MNTGSAFYIGKTHKICEDYTKNGMHPTPYVIVSDGCSSSPYTDFGSRILTQITSELLVTGEFTSDEVLIKADQICRVLNLSPQCLDATLLFSYVKDETYYVNVFGDGVVAKLRYDGCMDIVVIEYPSGAPYYLSYGLNLTRQSDYINLYGLKRQIKTYTLHPSGAVSNLETKEDIDGSPYYIFGSCKDYKTISLMSDGVLSFYELVSADTYKNKEPVTLNQVLPKLLDFKNFGDEFVDRRLQKFRKDCEKDNWFHADDISLAVLYLGD